MGRARRAEACGRPVQALAARHRGHLVAGVLLPTRHPPWCARVCAAPNAAHPVQLQYTTQAGCAEWGEAAGSTHPGAPGCAPPAGSERTASGRGRGSVPGMGCERHWGWITSGPCRAGETAAKPLAVVAVVRLQVAATQQAWQLLALAAACTRLSRAPAKQDTVTGTALSRRYTGTSTPVQRWTTGKQLAAQIHLC